jgi:hypothetical protein
MPVSMVTIECPCCGREMEVILVGAAHAEDEGMLAPARKPRRARRSKTKDQGGDGGLVDDDEELLRAPGARPAE